MEEKAEGAKEGRRERESGEKREGARTRIIFRH